MYGSYKPYISKIQTLLKFGASIRKGGIRPEFRFKTGQHQNQNVLDYKFPLKIIIWLWKFFNPLFTLLCFPIFS